MTSVNKELLKAYAVIYTIAMSQIIGHYYFPLPQVRWGNLILYTGIVIFCAGVLLNIWARSVMGKNWGPPGRHDRHRQKKLVTNGPFAYTRNPIYMGTFLLLLGLSFLLQSSLFFLIVLHPLYFIGEIKKEEYLLMKNFGKEYEDYKKRVPRFFLSPRLRL